MITKILGWAKYSWKEETYIKNKRNWENIVQIRIWRWLHVILKVYDKIKENDIDTNIQLKIRYTKTNNKKQNNYNNQKSIHLLDI